MSYKVLFVCTGNTCRSPMAEYIMKHLLKENGVENVSVSSAGIYASEGKPMSENSAKALKTLGIDYAGEHKSRRFTGDMAKEQDLILTVTDDHKACIPVRLDNMFSFREYVGVQDVGDPYGSNEEIYLNSAKQIYIAVQKIIEKLKKSELI